ncbi:xylulokinase [Cetobacterium sp.]|uniref:xylulokinase n=1 Tax=Cetobacterium sp. TaxID=2071632 RepID=UPI002FC8F5B1
MYIGIDLGTSSVKLLLVNSKGEILKSVVKEYSLQYPKENWMEQNPEDWEKSTFEGLKELIKGHENDIKAMSFSGQMHGMVVLDKEDKVIRPAILWCDQRTSSQCETLNSRYGKRIIELTGNKALTGFTAPKLLWLKENENENFKKINKIMLPKDYIAFKLSGDYSTDVSDASGMLLLNVEKREWATELLKELELSELQLPKLYESFEVVGELSEKVKKELGINNKVKIISGGGDQAVGAVGVGVVKEGVLSVALGTSGVVFANSSRYFVDDEARLHSFCHANGGYHQMGVMLSAAASLKWWVEDINQSKDYEIFLEKEAKSSQIDKNLFFLPYLMGERTPHNDPNAKGTLTGLNIQHRRGDITRCIVEGITFALRDSLELIKSMGISTDIVRVSGGGSKSEFWKQMIADIFNLRVDTVNSTEGPAYGAAILAMVGDGLYKDVNAACEALIKVIDTKYPNENNRKIYDDKYLKFKRLYPALKEV